MSLQEVEKSFIYTVPTIDSENERKVFIEFLNKINEEFQITNNPEFNIDYTVGLEIYSRETQDILIELSSNGKKYTVQYPNYIKSTHPSFSEVVYKNLKVISGVYNRYFVENDDTRRIIVTDMSSKDQESEKKLNVSISTNPNAGVLGSPINFYGNHVIKKKVSEVIDLVENYHSCKVFDLLPEAVLNKGKQLTKNYSWNGQENLWCFKNLIVPCCPRESSGYESELQNFLKVTHGVITYADYSEVQADFGNNLVTVKCLLNGESFEVSGLKQEFSFQFIVALNEHLKEKHNTCFYIWNYENNPWEQQTLIYLNVDTYKNFVYPNKRREFKELGSYIVEFYDENR